MARSAQGGASGGVVEGRAQGGASGGGGFRRTPSRAADDENMDDGDDVREHGSFYVPALQGGAAQAPQSVGSLQDAIDRLMRKVPEECKDCNDDLSRSFFERVIPTLNSAASALRGQYITEYGLQSDSGCVCVCGKCAMNFDMPLADMQAFSYTRVQGQHPEIILVSSQDQADLLVRNGATKLRWTAFGKAHTSQHINEHCPRQISQQEARQHSVLQGPLHDATLELPEPGVLSDTGLPPMKDLKDTLSQNKWTVSTLKNFFHLPFRFKTVVFPPLYMWPDTGQMRGKLYSKYTGVNKNAKEHGDQTFKNACRLYWWVFHPDSGLRGAEGSLDENRVCNSQDFHTAIPSGSAVNWVALMRKRVQSEIGEGTYVAPKYDQLKGV